MHIPVTSQKVICSVAAMTIVLNLQPPLFFFGGGFLFQERLQGDNDERNTEEQGKQIRTRETSAARVLRGLPFFISTEVEVPQKH
jgi:hypothetical protein